MAKQTILAEYDSRFWETYAGSVIKSPITAIIEIIINCWDAGATEVKISWPEIEKNGEIVIEDNGTGMSSDDFKKIWPTLSYNRTSSNQENVIKLDNGEVRPVYGKNGIGRFGMFCFSSEYYVETWKGGKCNVFKVMRDKPLTIELTDSYDREGNGTKIYCNKEFILNFVSSDELIKLIQRKFMINFNFKIFINEIEVIFDQLISGVIKKYQYKGNDILVTRYAVDPKDKMGGIMWRVNNRPVGEISWGRLKNIFDERRNETKKYLITVDVDCLVNDVLPDWTGFKERQFVSEVFNFAYESILDAIQDVYIEMNDNRKRVVVSRNLSKIRNLDPKTKKEIGRFISNVLDKCPTITDDVLSNVTDILLNCELSHNKYDLIQILANANPSELDSLYDVLNEWTIQELKVVFDELDSRLKHIEKIRLLSSDKNVKELSQLQPLFGQCLWIFGPEYDTPSFTSNKSIATVLRDLFHAKDVQIDIRRPDFVVTSDSSIGIYSSDKYDYNSSLGEVCGYNRVIIIELKKGGSKIGDDEINQAKKYAKALKSSGKINADKYICYVLGDALTPECTEEERVGEDIVIIPMSYHTLCSRAESRTFHLISKMRNSEICLNIEEDEIIQSELDAHPILNIVDNTKNQ